MLFSPFPWIIIISHHASFVLYLLTFSLTIFDQLLSLWHLHSMCLSLASVLGQSQNKCSEKAHRDPQNRGQWIRVRTQNFTIRLLFVQSHFALSTNSEMKKAPTQYPLPNKIPDMWLVLITILLSKLLSVYSQCSKQWNLVNYRIEFKKSQNNNFSAPRMSCTEERGLWCLSVGSPTLLVTRLWVDLLDFLILEMEVIMLFLTSLMPSIRAFP